MDGYDMMMELAQYYDADVVLGELLRWMDDDTSSQAAQDIAAMFGYNFETGEED